MCDLEEAATYVQTPTEHARAKKEKKNQQVCIWIQYKDAAYANLQMLER